MLRASRSLAVLGLLLATVVGTVAQQAQDLPFVPVEDSQCMVCHRGWTPPLRSFVRIMPPESAGAPIGEEFDYLVWFNEPWVPEKVPELRFVNPALDISGAPSLRFGGGPPDIDTESHHFIPIDTMKLTVPQQNVSRIEIPAGATSLVWSVVPSDTGPTAPDLTLLVTPPAANSTQEVNSNGKGLPEEKTYTLEELAAMTAAGNWTVGAEVTPVSAPADLAAPQASRVDFDIVVSARFDTAALTTLAHPKETVIRGGGNHLQTWRLEFVSKPAAGETVTIRFSTTPYFEHLTQPTSADTENIIEAPLVVEVRNGEPPVLYSPAAALVVPPQPVNGPTWTRISEAVGYASAFLLVTSIVSGGMFGQASRRGLNAVFHSAKRRVAYHNVLSYGLTVAALAHTLIFMAGGDARLTEDFEWTKGLLWWGGPAILAMFGLGLTGALQVPMIRRWSYPTWKWWHYGLTVATIAFTALHMVLDGQNFGTVVPEWQEAVPNPLYDSPLGDPAPP